MKLILFDDATARDWLPFTLTRPAGELRFGTMTLRQRSETVLGATCLGHLAAPHLAQYDEPWAPPVVDAGEVPADADLLFLSSRTVPAWQTAPEPGSEPRLIAVDGTVCGWYAPAGTDRPDAGFFADPDGAAPDLPVQEIAGTSLAQIWEVMAQSAEQVARDVAHRNPGPPRVSRPAGTHAVGGHALVRHPDAVIEPGVVLDLTRGPVQVDEGVTVRALTRLAGPTHIGPDSAILGGSIEAVSIGPRCKVRGEVEESIFLGYANKAHDGFLGHAIVGMWVNLGALTTNSDLKNNYGTVRVWTPAGTEDTGSIKIGAFIGDHVKTAIGTTLNTGTVVGAGANIFGAEPPATVVPPFAWGHDAVHELDRFLDTAAHVMARRDVDLSDGQRAMLRAAWSHARERGWTASTHHR